MLEVTHAAGKMQEETLQELIALELEPDRVRAGLRHRIRAIRFAKDLVQLVHQRSKRSDTGLDYMRGPVTIQHVNGKR